MYEFELIDGRERLLIPLDDFGFASGNDYIEIKKYEIEQEYLDGSVELEHYYEIYMPSFYHVCRVESVISTGECDRKVPYQFGDARLQQILSMITRCKTHEDIKKTILFVKSDLNDGDLIELSDGKKGEISWEASESVILKYYVMKKSGDIGKQLRMLYQGVEYHVLP